MANAYCTLSQLTDFYDERTLGMLSNDQNVRAADEDRIQSLLDVAASELDSYLDGRFSIVPPIPVVLTRWVAVRTAAFLFARRNERPKQFDADETWMTQWMNDLINGRARLPGASTMLPEITSSDTFGGESRFDGVRGFSPPPSRTGTSKGARWPGRI